MNTKARSPPSIDTAALMSGSNMAEAIEPGTFVRIEFGPPDIQRLYEHL